MYGRSGKRTARARATAAVLTLALSVCLIRPAIAGDEEAAQAAAHARKAAAAIDLGNYVDAAKEYEAAYMARQDPEMLARVGEAWQLAGERQKALTAYRSCARVSATSESRATCELRVRELESAAQPAPAGWAPSASLPAPVPAPSPVVWQPAPAPAIVTCPPPEPKSDDRSRVNWPAWTVLGAVVITGMVLGFVYLNRDTSLTMPNTTFGNKQF